MQALQAFDLLIVSNVSALQPGTQTMEISSHLAGHARRQLGF